MPRAWLFPTGSGGHCSWGLGRCWGLGLGPGQVTEGAPWGCLCLGREEPWGSSHPGQPLDTKLQLSLAAAKAPVGRVTGLAWGGSQP